MANLTRFPSPKRLLTRSRRIIRKILHEEHETRSHDQVAFIIQDRFTQWLQGYLCKNKSGHETTMKVKEFLGPQVECKYAYTDGSQEQEWALNKLGVLHDKSTPIRPQTNGVAERAVRRVKEGNLLRPCSIWGE